MGMRSGQTFRFPSRNFREYRMYHPICITPSRKLQFRREAHIHIVHIHIVCVKKHMGGQNRRTPPDQSAEFAPGFRRA